MQSQDLYKWKWEAEESKPRFEDATLLALKMAQGAMCYGMPRSLETGKGNGKDHPLDLLEALHFDLVQCKSVFSTTLTLCVSASDSTTPGSSFHGLQRSISELITITSHPNINPIHVLVFLQSAIQGSSSSRGLFFKRPSRSLFQYLIVYLI